MSVSISVILPTRGRPEGLYKAIATAHDLAEDPAHIEFILAADEDDPHLEEITSIAWSTDCTLLVGKRFGYKRLHEYWNSLASVAKGDYTLNWNDDCEMITAHWDSLILQNKAKFSVQFIRRDIMDVADTTFPVISRAVYKAMGHIALNAHADDWLGKVAEKAGIAVYRNDVVFHHHRINDLTSKERDQNYDLVRFNGPEMSKARDEDVRKILEAMK